ncbi:unnamed protein product [Paramecium pentaurelia]|uniref:AraC effector-binding domain-containing protein n=1 Tax=Paramecium pentaurelia TaxID=43138 RepID=A0A8S1WXD9_9CILI|nr:unnamed protein product [Paramecium pentaurelia]
MNPQIQAPKRKVVEQPSFTIVEELDPNTGQIRKAHEDYFSQQIHDKIPHRLHPKRTYCIYYEYQSPNDQNENRYKIVLGEMVSEVNDLSEGLVAVTVPAHRFCCFDCGPGPIPKVVIDAWSSLSTLSPEELGGVRSYDFDFEVYPEDINLKENIKFELFIGIQK